MKLYEVEKWTTGKNGEMKVTKYDRWDYESMRLIVRGYKEEMPGLWTRKNSKSAFYVTEVEA